MPEVVARIKDGNLVTKYEFNERLPVISRGLIGYFPFDGDYTSHDAFGMWEDSRNGLGYIQDIVRTYIPVQGTQLITFQGYFRKSGGLNGDVGWLNWHQINGSWSYQGGYFTSQLVENEWVFVRTTITCTGTVDDVIANQQQGITIRDNNTQGTLEWKEVQMFTSMLPSGGARVIGKSLNVQEAADNKFSNADMTKSNTETGWGHWGAVGHIGSHGISSDPRYFYREGQKYAHWHANGIGATANYLKYQSPSLGGSPGISSLAVICCMEDFSEVNTNKVYPTWNAPLGGPPNTSWTRVTRIGNTHFYLCEVDGLSQDGTNDLVGVYVKAGYKVYISVFEIWRTYRALAPHYDGDVTHGEVFYPLEIPTNFTITGWKQNIFDNGFDHHALVKSGTSFTYYKNGEPTTEYENMVRRFRGYLTSIYPTFDNGGNPFTTFYERSLVSGNGSASWDSNAWNTTNRGAYFKYFVYCSEDINLGQTIFGDNRIYVRVNHDDSNIFYVGWNSEVKYFPFKAGWNTVECAWSDADSGGSVRGIGTELYANAVVLYVTAELPMDMNYQGIKVDRFANDEFKKVSLHTVALTQDEIKLLMNNKMQVKNTTRIIGSEAVTHLANTGNLEEGNKVVSVDEILNDYTHVTDAEIVYGALSFNVGDASALSVGDEILLHQTQYNDLGENLGAGRYEYNRIKNIATNSITVHLPIGQRFFSGSFNKTDGTCAVTQVVRVPSYNTLTVNTGISIKGKVWDGYSGGIIAFRTYNDLVLTGTGKVDAKGIGFRGGRSAAQNGSGDGQCGEGHSSWGRPGFYSGNIPYTTDGGGTCYVNGAGGSHKTIGTIGTVYGGIPALPGELYGRDELPNPCLGAGGAGGHSNSGYPTGGAGGGLILISVDGISGDGVIDASGADGYNYNNDQGVWGSGGGAGGSIVIHSNSLISISRNLSGGLKNNGTNSAGDGGNGGAGRELISYAIDSIGNKEVSITKQSIKIRNTLIEGGI